MSLRGEAAGDERARDSRNAGEMSAGDDAIHHPAQTHDAEANT
jgi:hypothetical protein